MSFRAFLANNMKGYGNGHLSFHHRAFQSLLVTETWQPFSLSISMKAIIFRNVVKKKKEYKHSSVLDSANAVVVHSSHLSHNGMLNTLTHARH